MKKLLAHTIILLTLLSSCKTSRPTRPMEIYNLLNEIAPSAIHVPVELKLDELEELINEELGVIIEQQSEALSNAKEDLFVKATKSGQITADIQGEQIRIKVPLEIYLEKDINITKVKANGNIDLHFLTDYSISKDWELKTSTTIERHEWEKKPKLKIGFVKIPIKSIANNLVERSKATIGKQIDQQLQEQFKLKDYLAPAWKELQAPVLLSEEYDAWLKMVPQKVGITPLHTTDRKIKSTLVVAIETKVILGGFEVDTSKLPLLPFTAMTNKEDDRYKLNLKVGVPYTAVEALAKQELIGQTFEDGSRKVKVEDVKIFGQKDKVVINTQLSGSYNGSLYLTGEPHYDEKKEVLELKELDFELQTDNFLHKSMAWLFQRGLKKKLKESFRLPIGDKKAEWRQTIEQQLKNLDLPSNINLTVSIDELEIDRIFVLENALLLLVTSEGKVAMDIKNINSINVNKE